MTRYARYKKKFNSSTSLNAKLDRMEEEQVLADKEQSIEDLRASKSTRSKAVCLKCRQRGHSVKFCPEGVENTCYNCGSKEHTLKVCPQPKTDQLKYASCYICKQPGHLASKCEHNKNGMYPRGGGCRFCGSNQHLARDCSSMKGTRDELLVGVSINPFKDNPDDDLSSRPSSSLYKEGGMNYSKSTNDDYSVAKTKPKTKIVKF